MDLVTVLMEGPLATSTPKLALCIVELHRVPPDASMSRSFDLFLLRPASQPAARNRAAQRIGWVELKSEVVFAHSKGLQSCRS